MVLEPWMQQLITFIFMGVLGGIVYVWINSKAWSDLVTFKAVRRYVLGGIIGILYNFLYSEWSFPNFIMCFVAGYGGTHFIDKLVEKVSPPKKT